MGRLPYLPGLDGLRAIAVGVVVLYHGVEIFSVISGYLITSLLVAEWRRDRRIALRHFWGRRARRLLLALFLLLIGTLAFAVLFAPDEIARVRSETAAALAYVTNWSLILESRSYFEQAGSPSPLLHL